MLVGIVGKPSVGKSTFFKAATLAEAAIAPHPFTTISKNEGIGYVKIQCVDKEFNKQCNPREGFCIDGWRFVPIKMIDVAGLVPGAHKGLGMGNQFLDDLRQADVLIHIIDASGSTNEKGEPVDTGSYDPANDIQFLETELDLWYLNIFKKAWDKFIRLTVQENKEAKKAIAEQFSGLGGVTEEQVNSLLIKTNLKEKKLNEWSEEDIKTFAATLRKTTKPVIIAANKIDVQGAMDNINQLKKQFPDELIIPCSAESELALREAAKKELIYYIPGGSSFIIKSETLQDKQKVALDFIKKNILEKHETTGVQQVLNSAVFDFLRYIAIFPGGVNNLTDSKGNTLPDCFLLPPNSTALDFAFHIHTDLGKKFIRAIDVKTKRTVGKEHKLKSGDVVEIVADK